MRLFVLLLWSVLAILAIYYITMILHMWFGIFGKNTGVFKTLIPFYGWFKWMKPEDSSDNITEKSKQIKDDELTNTTKVKKERKSRKKSDI